MIKTARQRKGCSTTKFILLQNEKGQKNEKLEISGNIFCLCNKHGDTSTGGNMETGRRNMEVSAG